LVACRFSAPSGACQVLPAEAHRSGRNRLGSPGSTEVAVQQTKVCLNGRRTGPGTWSLVRSWAALFADELLA
jgi:hypothetical protein